MAHDSSRATRTRLTCSLLALLAACATTPTGPAAPAAPATPAVVAAPASAPVAAPPPPAATGAADAKRRAEFDQSLARWHGATVKELTTKLGTPSALTRSVEGQSVYSYVRAAPPKGAAGAAAFTCVVRFTVDAKSNQVVGHRFEGC